MSKTNYTLSGFEEVTLEELQLKQANGELIKGKIYITQETGPDSVTLDGRITILENGVGQMSMPPNDGKLYGIRDGQWEEIV